MRRTRSALEASGLALAVWACGTASPVEPGAPSATNAGPPTWCAAIDDALGAAPGAAGFRCLEVPNFLVTGFYGTVDNPERSDFVNACFAGESDAANRLRMSVRPLGDLRFSYRVERAAEASGRLDLGFVGPWGPSLTLSGARSETFIVTVELADAEIRVLSSVAEILGQSFREADVAPDGPVGVALRACLASLCDASGEPLVYTAKVLAAVPVIRLESTARFARAGSVSVAPVAGFEVKEGRGATRGLELRAQEKLNVAALLERAAPALARAKTCDVVTEAETRRFVVSKLRETGLHLLSGRAPAGIADDLKTIREVLGRTPGALTEHEHRDVLHCVEAFESTAREIHVEPPTRAVCQTRDLVEALLGENGENNRLHELLTDVAEPLHQRLTEVANERSLPCADPAFYLDADGDGFGDPRQVVRASKQPEHYVVNALDCYDHNGDARPGQTKYFDHPRGDNSFDYDCDGKSTPESDVVAGGCKAITRFGIPIRCWAEPGWRDSSPKCGEQGRWFSTCEEGMLSCDEGPVTARRQVCR